MVTIIQKRQEILQKITKVSCEKNITLVAVSKTFTKEAIIELNQYGQVDFGENYVQEAIKKITEIQNHKKDYRNNAPIIWHFIGQIQSNKTQNIADYFDWVHTIDREKIALRLHTQRPVNLKPLNVCIQINIDQALSKNGILFKGNNTKEKQKSIDDILLLANYICKLPMLKLRGLMAIPDIINNAQAFQNMHDLFKILQIHLPEQQIDTLCMGMSQDFEQAIECGATMVRIGTAIFGIR